MKHLLIILAITTTFVSAFQDTFLKKNGVEVMTGIYECRGVRSGETIFLGIETHGKTLINSKFFDVFEFDKRAPKSGMRYKWAGRSLEINDRKTGDRYYAKIVDFAEIQLTQFVRKGGGIKTYVCQYTP